MTKQYLFYNGQGTVSPPKSSTSVRYVSIPDEAARLLEQEHAKHPKNPYMFPSPVTGEMYHPDAIVKIHRKICKDIGLENVRFHDLRHSFATTALQCGVDVKTVSTMLGHSSAGFTLNVYTHSTSRMQQEAARTVGNVNAKDAESVENSKNKLPAAEKSSRDSLFSSHFVQPGTFCPIAVGVRVGVNVAEWRTSAQVALTLRCGRQPRETKKNQACLRKNTPRRQPRFFFKKFG